MEESKKKELVGLLKEWFSIKSDIAKVEVAEFFALKKESIEQSRNQLMNYLKETGRHYGQEIDEATKVVGSKDEDVGRIIDNYEEQIKTITEIYEEKHKSILREKAQWEANLADNKWELLKITLREEANVFMTDKEKTKINELINKDKYDEVEENTNVLKTLAEEKKKIEEDRSKEQKNREEIERAISSCEERIEQNYIEMKKQIDIKNSLKDEEFHNINQAYLVIMKERSVLQRAVYWVRNKFNGSKRFTNEIITPLKNGIENLRDKKIPKIKEKVGKVEDASSLKTVKKYAIDKPKEYLYDKPREFISNTYSSIIQFYQNQKENIVQSIEGSIKEKKEELERKKQDKKHEKTEEQEIERE